MSGRQSHRRFPLAARAGQSPAELSPSAAPRILTPCSDGRLAIDPASAGGCNITPTEEARISSAIDELRAELDRLERDVAQCAMVPVRGTARA